MSQTTPLIAVVTPVYNGAKYLAETMACVQAQTYPHLVHVVLDNASTDATPDIIRSFENRRVPLITARNDTTVPFAENWERVLGLVPKEATYFRLLCADDKMTENAIERMVEIGLANPNVGVIGCGFQVMDVVQESRWPRGVTVVAGREAARRFFMGEGEIIGPHLMHRADVLALRKPFFDARYNGIDTESCLFLLQHVDWACTTEILAWTRVHDESLSHVVMHGEGKHFSDWLRYIHKYGRWAMSPDEYTQHKRAFERYYRRRLVLWLRRRNGHEVVRKHMALARELERGLTPLDFVDAFADVVLRRLKFRAHVNAGFPLG